MPDTLCEKMRKVLEMLRGPSPRRPTLYPAETTAGNNEQLLKLNNKLPTLDVKTKMRRTFEWAEYLQSKQKNGDQNFRFLYGPPHTSHS
jgi:hypothetical protein